MVAASIKHMCQRSMSTFKAYDKSEHRLLIIGGNGFVGSNILQRAVQKGIEVRSLNPSGKPQWQDVPWIDNVDWHMGNVFDKNHLAKAVEGVTGVISTVGAFGDNEFMEKMCGDATIVAAEAAQKAGVDRFVFVSNSRVGSWYPSWLPIYGYYHGKERAEAAVRERFPDTGVALRPGFIYGWRRTKKGQGIPLQVFGAPMSMLGRDLGAVSSVIKVLPFIGDEFQAAIHVSAVAKAAVLSAIGPVHERTLDTMSMLKLADSFHLHE
ncbi:putative NAD(P)-binding domain, NAD(P)-binding domain superfamily [Plasmopara halstedii]